MENLENEELKNEEVALTNVQDFGSLQTQTDTTADIFTNIKDKKQIFNLMNDYTKTSFDTAKNIYIEYSRNLIDKLSLYLLKEQPSKGIYYFKHCRNCLATLDW